MNGFEAISAYNGWSMALLGASIVFSGLVILSCTIFQIHKILMLWENRASLMKKKSSRFQAKASKEDKFSHPDYCPENVNEVADFYMPLVEKLGHSFQLADLYKLTHENNFPHPHLTIKRLREENILMPVGDGIFTFNQNIKSE